MTLVLLLSLISFTHQDAHGTATINQASNVVSAQSQQEKRLREWEKSLRALGSVEGATLFVDVDERSDPGAYSGQRALWTKPMGLEGLRFYAMQTRRELEDMNGVYVMSRQKSASLSANSLGPAAVIKWLQTLSSDNLASLANGEAKGKDVPSDVLERLIGYANCQGDPNVLVRRTSNASLKLVADLSITSQDANTGLRSTQIVEFNDGMSQGQEPVEPDSIVPIEKSQGSDLDFGEGRLVSLGDLIAQVSDQRHRLYYYDARLRDSWIFVSGKMDYQTFDKALQKITGAGYAKPDYLGENDLMNELRAFLEGPGASMFQDELKDLPFTVSDLAKDGVKMDDKSARALAGQVGGTVASMNLSPGSMVKFGLRLRLVADPGGKTEIQQIPYQAVDGKRHTMRVFAFNAATIILPSTERAWGN